MDQRVVNYVQQMKERGMSDEQIKASLQQAGWQDDIINQLLGGDNVPKPEDFLMTEEALQNLNPKTVLLFFLANNSSIALIITAIGLFLILIISLIIDGYFMPILFFIFVGCLFALMVLYIVAQLEYRYYHYQLKEEGFYKERGIIAKKYVTIPYEKIQNIDIYQPLMARLLKLYIVKIQTAGNSGISSAEGILPGLSQSEAETLKNELLRRSRMFRQSNF